MIQHVLEQPREAVGRHRLDRCRGNSGRRSRFASGSAQSPICRARRDRGPIACAYNLRRRSGRDPGRPGRRPRRGRSRSRSTGSARAARTRPPPARRKVEAVELVEGRAVDRHRQQLAGDAGQHPVLVGAPAGEARQIGEDLLAVGVEDVRAVAMDQDPVLVRRVEGVAGDMRPPVAEEDPPAGGWPAAPRAPSRQSLRPRRGSHRAARSAEPRGWPALDAPSARQLGNNAVDQRRHRWKVRSQEVRASIRQPPEATPAWSRSAGQRPRRPAMNCSAPAAINTPFSVP